MPRTTYAPIVAIILLLLPISGVQGAICGATFADLNASGSTDIVDVQCTILVTLFSLAGSVGAPPACLSGDLDDADTTCDGDVDVADVIVTTNTVLEVDLSIVIDANQDGCPDACDTAVTLAPVISEIRYAAGGGVNDTFVEIAGTPGAAVNGLQLVGVDGQNGGFYNIIALDGVFNEDGYFVVAHPSASPPLAAVADQTDALVDYQDGPDSLLLFGDSAIQDALGYGAFGGTDAFAGETAPAPAAPAGASLSRDEFNSDTGDNSADFEVSLVPSPGAANSFENQPPSADLACPTDIVAGGVAQFDASGSADPEGLALQYVFDFGFGDPTTTSNPLASTVFPSAGPFVVQLTVIDSFGAEDTDTCEVIVGETATPPTVVLTAPSPGTEIDIGQTLTVAASAFAAPGQEPVFVEFFVDGVSIGLDPSPPFEVSYTVPPDAPINVAIQLTAVATDAFGLSSTSNAVDLLLFDLPPSASIIATPGEGATATLDASFSFDLETPLAELEFRFDYQGDGVYDTLFSPEPIVVHDYILAGTYSPTVEVRDAIGQTSQASTEVDIEALTVVSGDVGDTNWTGTIGVVGNVTVLPGSTLTIAPGTRVEFLTTAPGVERRMTVLGTVQAMGTEALPIVFTMDNTPAAPGSWVGIELSGEPSTLEHVVLEYAQLGLTVTSTGHTVDFAEIRDSSGCGVRVDGGQLEAMNIELRTNGDCGAQVLAGGELDVSDCTVADNAGVGLDFVNDAGGEVTRCRIEGNGLEGARIVRIAGGQAPSLHTNDLLGNGSGGGLEIYDAEVALDSDSTEVGSQFSNPWSPPVSSPIEYFLVEFEAEDPASATATVLDNDSGALLVGLPSPEVAWLDVTSAGSQALVLGLTDTSGTAATRVAMPKAAAFSPSATHQLAVINDGPSIDVSRNYFGAYPNIASAVAVSAPDDVRLYGLQPQAYNGLYDPVVTAQGTLNGTVVWNGVVRLTGPVTVPLGGLLIVQPGTEIGVDVIDTDSDGENDGIITIEGAAQFMGNSLTPVFIGSLADAPTRSDWRGLKLLGAADLEFVDVRSARTGVETGGPGPHDLTGVRATECAEHGFWIRDGSNPSAVGVESRSCGVGGLVDSGAALTADAFVASDCDSHGLHVNADTSGAALVNARLTGNGGAGLRVDDGDLFIDQSEFSTNAWGIFASGSSTVFASNSVLSENAFEGVFARGKGLGPAPFISVNFSHLVGNSQASGAALAAPGLSLTSGAPDTGLVTSAPWTSPAGGEIAAVAVDWTPAGAPDPTVVPAVTDASGQQPAVLTLVGPNHAEFAGDAGGSAGLDAFRLQIDDNSPGAGGTAVATSAYVRQSGSETEVGNTALGALIDASSNYWGDASGPDGHAVSLEPGVIDTSSFSSLPYPDVGPQ